MEAPLIPFGTTTRFPLVSDRRSALVLDFFPVLEPAAARLELTMTVMPVTFLRADGKPTGYSIGCREANFSLSMCNGHLTIETTKDPELSFEHVVEAERERGVEVNPKAKASSKSRETLKVAGSDDNPVVTTIKRDTVGWIQWIISASPLASANSILQCSRSVSLKCTWDSRKKGSIRLYAPRYVYCVGRQAVNPGAAMLASFLHWLRALEFRDDWREELFEIVEPVS